jgi:hypothetical protein
VGRRGVSGGHHHAHGHSHGLVDDSIKRSRAVILRITWQSWRTVRGDGH